MVWLNVHHVGWQYMKKYRIMISEVLQDCPLNMTECTYSDCDKFRSNDCVGVENTHSTQHHMINDDCIYDEIINWIKGV